MVKKHSSSHSIPPTNHITTCIITTTPQPPLWLPSLAAHHLNKHNYHHRHCKQHQQQKLSKKLQHLTTPDFPRLHGSIIHCNNDVSSNLLANSGIEYMNQWALLPQQCAVQWGLYYNNTCIRGVIIATARIVVATSESIHGERKLEERE